MTGRSPEQQGGDRVEVTLSAEVAEKISLLREVVTTQEFQVLSSS